MCLSGAPGQDLVLENYCVEITSKKARGPRHYGLYDLFWVLSRAFGFRGWSSLSFFFYCQVLSLPTKLWTEKSDLSNDEEKPPSLGPHSSIKIILDYISFLQFQGYSKVGIAEIPKFLGKIAMILGGFAGGGF
jgi:hypothetical protein